MKTTCGQKLILEENKVKCKSWNGNEMKNNMWAEFNFGREQSQIQKLEFGFDFNRYGWRCVDS